MMCWESQSRLNNQTKKVKNKSSERLRLKARPGGRREASWGVGGGGAVQARAPKSVREGENFKIILKPNTKQGEKNRMRGKENTVCKRSYLNPRSKQDGAEKESSRQKHRKQWNLALLEKAGSSFSSQFHNRVRTNDKTVLIKIHWAGTPRPCQHLFPITLT